MHDMNFFAPLQVSRGTRQRGPDIRILLGLVVAVIVIAPIAGFGYEWMLKNSISSLQAELSQPDNAAALTRLDALQAQKQSFDASLPVLQKEDSALTSMEWISEKVLQVLNDTVPKQIQFNVVAMANRDVQISGISVDRPAIAEMEYALRQSGIAENIMVSSILRDENGSYQYSINFKAKDVMPQ